MSWKIWCMLMSLSLHLLLIHALFEVPPFPGVIVSDLFQPSTFDKEFSNIWASDHQEVSKDASQIKLTLDLHSGSGIKSKNAFLHGYFSASIKLPANYTAGVVTTFYASNNEVYGTKHDELDLEFLGTIPGEQYVIQTNIYGDGSTQIGREQRFRLWFDPTLDFHRYAILWTPSHIVFFVDEIPIREYQNVKGLDKQYPVKPMSIYATIWDASSWATDGGQYKVNYTFAPFTAIYTNIIISGCILGDSIGMEPVCYSSNPSNVFLENHPLLSSLSNQQVRALSWVRLNYMIYDYCKDIKRYPQGSLPECT